MTDPAPRAVRVDIGGGDPYGRGDQPRLSWWLPEGASAQLAYRVVSDDGYDSGWVGSPRQSYVDVPVFDRSRRATTLRVRVRTDRGESDWSQPAYVYSGLSSADWVADWIGVDEPVVPLKGHRPAYWLRGVVDVAATDAARLHATALGLYEVYVNGERVGDHELTPGYTQYRARVPYQWFDIGALLRPGPNVVAALLVDGWYRGQVGLPRAADQYGRATALRLQIERPDGHLIGGTDARWRTARSHITYTDLIGGQAEDRRLVDPAIHDQSYEDGGWAVAVPRDVDVTIVPSIAPPVRRVETIYAVSATTVVDGAVIVDLGRNINGWARVANLGPPSTSLVLRHGEHLDPSGDLTTAHLDVSVPIVPDPLPVGQVDAVTSAGRDRDVFEPRFTTHGFRYLRIEGHPGGLSAEDVSAAVVHSDLRRTGWFECSDQRLNRLHDAVVWSLRSNMCAIPTDCPQRERAGWTGDWQVFAPTAAFLYDVLGFTRSWLRDVALDQRADGCVANMSPCPPAEGFDGPLGGLNGSVGWGDVVVSAPWDLYQAYGDESLLHENWAMMRAWVDYAAQRAAGGRHPTRAARRPVPVEHEKFLWDTDFHWGEWLEPGFDVSDFAAFAAADKSEVATAYLCRSAGTVADIGEVLGVDTARYRELAAGARSAWLSEFLHADGALAAQTQASHVRALAFSLVPDEMRGPVSARLVDLILAADTHLTTGFLSTGLLLPVLADTGHLDTAYALLRQDTEPSWLTMIDRGATTIWERWNGVDADGVAHESLNHYGKGAVASFLHRYVGGLRPTAPGYRRFEVRPHPGGGVTSATVRHDSPYGRIEVSWQRVGSSMALEVGVPGGTTASVVPSGTAPREVGPGIHRWTQ
jgi:alpha-L-rhamnosidase